MLNSKNLFWSLLTTLLIFSCGKEMSKNGTTTVSFMGGQLDANDLALVVAGRSDDSVPPSYFTLDIPSGTNTLSLELPNGTWNFSSIGWSHNDMSGDFYCSQPVGQKDLTGESTSVTINIDKPSCWAPPFNIPEMRKELITDTYSVAPLSVVTCARLESGVKNKADYFKMKKKGRSQLWTSFPALADYCSTDNNGGSIQSFEVILPTVPLTGQSGVFDSWNQSFPNSLDSIFKSQCFDFSSSASGPYYAETDLQLPLGPQDSLQKSIFHPVIMAYSASNCAGESKVFGLANDGELTGKEVIYDIESSKVVAYLLDESSFHESVQGYSPQVGTPLCFDTSFKVKFTYDVDTNSIDITESAGTALEIDWISNSELAVSPVTPPGIWTNSDDYGSSQNIITISGSSTPGGEPFSIDFPYLTCSSRYSPELELNPASVGGSYAATEGVVFTIDVNDLHTGRDIDRDDEAITYSCTTQDQDLSPVCDSLSGLEFNTATGVFSWTPISSQSGEYSFTIVGVDPYGHSDSISFSVTVADVNIPPSLSYTGDTFLTADGANSFTINVGDGGTDFDSDNQAITYSCSDCSGVGASINDSTGVLTWTPTDAYNNFYNFTVTGDDGQGASNSISSIVVTLEVNYPPTITCPGLVYVLFNHNVEVDCDLSDPNGDSLTVTYSGSGCLDAADNQVATHSGVFSAILDDSTFTISFAASSLISAGTCSYDITVSDGHATARGGVSITPTNSIPTKKGASRLEAP